MNWKGFFIVVCVFLVIYGAYYLVTQSDFIKLLTLPRIFDPFATSAPSVRTPSETRASRTASPVISTPSIRTPTPPQGFSVSDLSPYFEKATISSVRRPDRYGTGGEFTVRVDSTITAGVDVTGWTVRSNRGSLTITGAYGNQDPVNRLRIVIRPGTSALFYATTGAFVKNIELNACTGYLNDSYVVSPKLPNNCPRSSRSELVNFSGECQNFINSLGSCKVPAPVDLNRFTASRDAACRSFLDTFTYYHCVQRYSSLPNFYSYGWRVWVGTEFRFDPSHDRLFLLDTAGKLVDEYIY